MTDLIKTDKDGRRYIDCTPRWEGVLPIMLHGYENGAPVGRAAMQRELTRMAQLADKWVEHCKEQENATSGQDTVDQA